MYHSRILVLLIVFGLILGTLGHNDYCILYDNSTVAEHATVYDYIAKFGIEPLKEHINNDDELWNVQTQGHPNGTICTKEMIEQWHGPQNITIVITDPHTIMLFNLTIPDPAISEQVQFALSYDKERGICGNPPTTTISLLCRTMTALSPIRGMMDWMYPYADKYGTNNTAVFSNSTLFSFMNSTRTDDPRTVTESWNDMINKIPTFAQLMPTASSGLGDLNMALEDGVLVHSKNFISNLMEQSSHEDFWKAKKDLSAHLYTPVDFFSTIKNHPGIKKAFHRWKTDGIRRSKEFVDNVANVAQYYKTIEWNMKNMSTLSVAEIVNELSTKVSGSSYHTSIEYALLHMKHTKASELNNVAEWSNPSDIDNQLFMNNTMDVFNLVQCVYEWTFRIDGPCNITGCLGVGIPYIPKTTLLCRPPVIIGVQFSALWPSGFVLSGNTCSDYFNPLNYWPMAIKTTGTLIWWSWLQIHTGVAQWTGWTLYDIQTQYLPPDALPCLLSGPLLWNTTIAIWLIFGIFFTIGLVENIRVDVSSEIYGEDPDEGEAMKKVMDITKLIPTPSLVLEKFTKPIDAIASGDPTQVLNALGESQKESVESLSDKFKSSVPKQTKGISKTLPKIKAPAAPKLKMPPIRIPKIK